MTKEEWKQAYEDMAPVMNGNGSLFLPAAPDIDCRVSEWVFVFLLHPRLNESRMWPLELRSLERTTPEEIILNGIEL